MARKAPKRTSKREARLLGSIVDPRHGDIEDDASSTKRRSMLSLFGSMLVEISLPKLLLAWALLLVVPGLLLGFAPIVFAEWLKIVTDKLSSLVIGFWSLLIFALLIGIGWFGWRTLFRLVEKNFWALNSIVVEPGYAAWCDQVWLVAAEHDVARDRLMARNGFSEAEANQRLSSQRPWQDRAPAADFVIHNNGDMNAVREAVRGEFERVRALFIAGRLSPTVYHDWAKQRDTARSES